MSEEQIDCNYHEIINLGHKIKTLDARILKLEEIIVKVCNEEPEAEPHYSIEDMAEIALENRANEDRGEDR